MSHEFVQTLQKRSILFVRLLNVILSLLVLFYMVILIGGIWSIFLPADQFQLVVGISHWKIIAPIATHFELFALVPYDLLHSTTFTFNSKTTFLIFHFGKSLLSFAAMIYGVILVRKIVVTFSENSPFTPQNANRVRIISYIVIGYFGLIDLLVSLCLNLFVMDVVSIYLLGVFHPWGLGIGFLLLLLAKVFQYGSFLQNKIDTA